MSKQELTRYRKRIAGLALTIPCVLLMALPAAAMPENRFFALSKERDKGDHTGGLSGYRERYFALTPRDRPGKPHFMPLKVARLESRRASPDTLREVETPQREEAYHWPIKGASEADISSHYGFRKDPFTGQRAFHKGIDIPAPKGTPVLASMGGAVAEVGTHARLGRYVKVEHDDGMYALYGHLSDWSVKAGDAVAQGEAIGKVGSTGRSTGAHLDFSLRRGKQSFDPLPYLLGEADEETLELSSRGE